MTVGVILGVFAAGLLLGGGIGAVVMAKLMLSRLTDEEPPAEAAETQEP